MIARVIAALRQGGADPVVVVVPPAEVPGAPALAAEAAQAGACVVVAERPPPDMRASVERGLDHLAQMATSPPATFLLAPGDSPGISAELVARIVARARAEPDAIVIPQSQGRRGHPIALPWSLAAEIRSLPGDVGINALVARHAAQGRRRSTSPIRPPSTTSIRPTTIAAGPCPTAIPVEEAWTPRGRATMMGAASRRRACRGSRRSVVCG